MINETEISNELIYNILSEHEREDKILKIILSLEKEGVLKDDK